MHLWDLANGYAWLSQKSAALRENEDFLPLASKSGH
jgi:hypothetical protein